MEDLQREIATKAEFTDRLSFDPATVSAQSTGPADTTDSTQSTLTGGENPESTDRELPIIAGVDQAFLDDTAVSAIVALRDGEIKARGPPEEVVTEELLADVFEIDAEVDITHRGPRVTPLQAIHGDDDTAPDDETDDIDGPSV